jgi:transposase-like protein
MDAVKTPKRACPWCGCTDVHRSRRRGLIDRGLNQLLRISPYRCEECDRRFYGREVLRPLRA